MRDRFMHRLAGQFPAYGFATNAGYGTTEHLAALGRDGPCPFYRRSFAPLRQGVLDFPAG
jgi:ribonuclease HII